MTLHQFIAYTLLTGYPKRYKRYCLETSELIRDDMCIIRLTLEGISKKLPELL